jgi:uncharacterized membrane protein
MARSSKSKLAVCAALSLFGLPSLAMATTYNVTILNSLGGPYSEANGINDAGQVVGTSSVVGNSLPHPVIWNGTTPTSLVSPGFTGGDALAINNPGQAVGFLEDNSGITAVVWNGTTPTVLSNTNNNRTASGINNLGQVAGNFNGQAVVWNGTTPELVPVV